MGFEPTTSWILLCRHVLYRCVTTAAQTNGKVNWLVKCLVVRLTKDRLSIDELTLVQKSWHQKYLTLWSPDLRPRSGWTPRSPWSPASKARTGESEALRRRWRRKRRSEARWRHWRWRPRRMTSPVEQRTIKHFQLFWLKLNRARIWNMLKNKIKNNSRDI